MVRGCRNLLTVATVWMTAVSMAIASIPRVECACPNGRPKAFRLSSVRNQIACCRMKTQPQSGGTSSCRCCDVMAPNEGVEDPISSASSNAPSVQRKGCVKSVVAPEVANVEECRQIDQAPDLLILSCAEPAVCEIQPHYVTYRFPIRRPPAPELIILLQHFRN